MAETQKTNAQNIKALKVNEKKWTKPLMDAGWSVVPNIIIEKQRALGLDAMQMNILLHLMQYWWHEENVPHPSVKKIADALGVTERTIQKRITELDSLGFIKREERRNTRHGSTTNLYRFDGLIAMVTPFAEEKIKASKAKAEADAERVKRKKPRIVVNNDI